MPATGMSTAAAPSSLALHWQRTAAEHRAVYVQTFRLAGERLAELARDLEPGTWAMIADADETILDNSLYAVERAAIGAGFTSDSWTEWVARREATALPGAREFLHRVHQLGGLIAIVTNRKAHECADTEANFARQLLPYDVMLCRPAEGDADKDARFRAVEKGWTAALEPFGDRWFVFPNPVYGSWQENAVE